ncbi:hypothetical protein QUF72_19130 [Desulfobacterales bacterium HSG2]|nr:hypothetical protein [Desulfobacterales bacterium HSG2]
MVFDVFTILKKFYIEGGLDISTPFTETDNNDFPEDEQDLVILTVIQADADIITYIPERAVENSVIREAYLEKTWEAHQKKTETVIRSLHRSRIFFRGMSKGLIFLGAVILLQGGYKFWIGEGTLYYMIAGLLSGLSSFLVKHGGRFLVQWYLKRKSKT